MKQKKEGKFKQFIEMLKDLSLNIPLLEALEKMPGYDRFIKQLVTKKRISGFEKVGGLHYYSTVTSRSLAQKKGDLVVFKFHALLRHPNLLEHYVT